VLGLQEFFSFIPVVDPQTVNSVLDFQEITIDFVESFCDSLKKVMEIHIQTNHACKRNTKCYNLNFNIFYYIVLQKKKVGTIPTFFLFSFR
jgi:hypothetical protein